MAGGAVSSWTPGDAQLSYREEAKWLRGKTTRRGPEHSLI